MVKFVFFENKEELAKQLRDHLNEKHDADNQECNHLNKNLRNKFSNMTLFKSQSFFLDNRDLDEDSQEGTKTLKNS